MFRLRVMLVGLAMVASACTTSSVVVGESGATPTGPRVGATLTETELAAALATPVPEVGGAAPQATPTPEWSVSGEAAQQTAVHSASAEDDSDPHLDERYGVGRCYRFAHYAEDNAISCSEPHRAEVVLIGEFPLSAHAPYPGRSAGYGHIDSECLPAVRSLGIIDGSMMTRFPLMPFEDDWDQGDRSFVCFIEFDHQVTSSLGSIIAAQQGERAQEQAARDDAWAAQQAADQASHRAAEEQRVADAQIHVGDCLVGEDLDEVPCSQRHVYLAFARTNLASAGGVYPGLSLVLEQAEDYCELQLHNAGLAGSILIIYPHQWEWEDFGIRAVTCLVSGH